MFELLGKTVVFVGRLQSLPRRRARRFVEDLGGTVRLGLTRRTDLLVVGHRADVHIEGGGLSERLARADRFGVLCVSENAFLRAVRLLEPPEPMLRDLRARDLSARSGLDGDTIRALSLFDVLDPLDGWYGFRDLVTAREVKRLLREGVELVDVIRGASRVRRAQSDPHTLARTKLVFTENGIAKRVGSVLTELDGQIRLALPETGPPSAELLFESAEAAEEEGDLETAEELYRRCTAADRKDPVAPFNLSNVLRARGRWQDAESFLRLSLARDPALAEAWYNLADLMEEIGRSDLAGEYLDRATAIDPDFADAFFNLARLRFQASDWAGALGAWERYLRLDPRSEWSRRARDGAALCRRYLGLLPQSSR